MIRAFKCTFRLLFLNTFYSLHKVALNLLFFSLNPRDWTKNKSFCPAPWIHAHLDATGSRKLCCVAHPPPEEVSQLSFSDFWNSSYLRSIRRQMMSGHLPVECINCSVPNKVDTYQQGLKIYFRHHFKRLRRATDADGKSHFPILFLDYRSRLCNLMCKFCGPESSSRWIESAKQNSKIMSLMHSPDQVDLLNKKNSESKYDSEFLPLVENNPIEKIYFAGGEPLLASQHFKVLDNLIYNQKSNDVFLSYNTNLTINDSVFDSWLLKLIHFKKVDVYCSIDGTEEVTKYIRTGMNYNQFKKNIDKLKKFKMKQRNFYFNFDVTMTSVFLLNLVEFSKFAIEQQVPVDAKLMLGYEYKSLFLRCEFLPKNIRKALIDEWLVFYNTLSLKNMRLLEKMKMNLEIVQNLTQFNAELIHRGLQQSEAHDIIFKDEKKFSSFLRNKEIVYNWWLSLF